MQSGKKNLDCLLLLIEVRAEGKYLSIGIIHLDASLSIIQSSIQYHPKNNEGDNGIGIMIITSCTALLILLLWPLSPCGPCSIYGLWE